MISPNAIISFAGLHATENIGFYKKRVKEKSDKQKAKLATIKSEAIEAAITEMERIHLE